MSQPCLFLQALPEQSAFPWLQPDLAKRVEVMDQYALSADSLGNRQVLILTMHQDQRWLSRNRDLLEQFVEGGGRLLIQGQIALPFLGILRQFQRKERPQLADFGITFRQPRHPVFSGIDAEALNQRRGVAGFYARGSNPPPEGAEIISTMSGGRLPVDWIARVGTGLVFTHSGNDVWTSFDDRAANTGFAFRLVEWALGEGHLSSGIAP